MELMPSVALSMSLTSVEVCSPQGYFTCFKQINAQFYNCPVKAEVTVLRESVTFQTSNYTGCEDKVS